MKDIEKILSNSTRLMYQEALAMGIKCEIVQPPYLLSMKKGAAQWMSMAARTSVQSSVGKEIADDKLLTKQLLAYYGIPTAEFVAIDGVKSATQLRKVMAPFVVKPRRGSFGEEVHTGVDSISDVETIIQESVQDLWLVEKHLQGKEFRITCVDYQMIAAAERLPAFVTGDGKSTIEGLIKQKNLHPDRGDGHVTFLATIQVNQDTYDCLERQKHSLSSVPSAGERVYLKSVSNMSQGGESLDVTAQVCLENKKLFEKISRLVDLNIIGIDVMCRSLAEPLEGQSSAGIIEINASPGIDIHQAPYKKDSLNIARPILEMTLRLVRTN